LNDEAEDKEIFPELMLGSIHLLLSLATGVPQIV
jgi:hypothetical protein